MKDLQRRIRQFATTRDWEQFHTPKNLTMALVAEAGELVECFQWLTPEESYELPTEKQTEVSHEMADVLIYLLRLADVLSIDIEQAVAEKMEINERKYPAEQVRGSAKKSTEYES